MGNNDPKVSNYLKAWIVGSGEAVCGVFGPGTSKEITANWVSPFEGESAGEKMQKTGGLVQAATDMTSITSLNSRQVWQGNRPTAFPLELKFYALQDPESEVMAPLRALERMIAPEVNSGIPVGQTADGNMVGRVPNMVVLNIGGKVIYKDCVLESISMPYDKEVARNGGWIRSTVSLQIATIQMLNRSEIP